MLNAVDSEDAVKVHWLRIILTHRDYSIESHAVILDLIKLLEKSENLFQT